MLALLLFSSVCSNLVAVILYVLSSPVSDFTFIVIRLSPNFRFLFPVIVTWALSLSGIASISISSVSYGTSVLYSSVFLLGRYNSDKDILKSSENFSYNYGEILEVIYSKRIDLEIKYLTIHKSKGLQADYVFIINNRDIGSGFPSKIVEDTVIEKLLESNERYPFSEERRLLYVALTRSKVKTFLLVEKGNASVFIKELIKDYKVDKKIT